jgi:hypothetical protein
MHKDILFILAPKLVHLLERKKTAQKLKRLLSKSYDILDTLSRVRYCFPTLPSEPSEPPKVKRRPLFR